MFRSLWKDESGATAIEYGLIAGFICLAIVLAVAALGDTVLGLYQSVSDGFTEAASK